MPLQLIGCLLQFAGQGWFLLSRHPRSQRGLSVQWVRQHCHLESSEVLASWPSCIRVLSISLVQIVMIQVEIKRRREQISWTNLRYRSAWFLLALTLLCQKILFESATLKLWAATVTIIMNKLRVTTSKAVRHLAAFFPRFLAALTSACRSLSTASSSSASNSFAASSACRTFSAATRSSWRSNHRVSCARRFFSSAASSWRSRSSSACFALCAVPTLSLPDASCCSATCQQALLKRWTSAPTSAVCASSWPHQSYSANGIDQLLPNAALCKDAGSAT